MCFWWEDKLMQFFMEDNGNIYQTLKYAYHFTSRALSYRNIGTWVKGNILKHHF